MRGHLRNLLSVAVLGAVYGSFATAASAGSFDAWTVDSAEDWKGAKATASHLALADGLASPKEKTARYSSVVKTFRAERSAKAITFEQSGAWTHWSKASVGPKGTVNAPVFLPVGKDDYWYFAEKSDERGAYHAWHSSDLKEWTHHGKVMDSRWMTSAEHANGKFYLYYDKPNDEDPHLVIHKDLTDGSRKNVGKVLADPSHGSDAGFFRDADGSFHVIYEDWSPINASAHSWDSPLAGHAESPDGIKGFEPHEHTPPIDERTVPLPEFGTYNHGPTGEHRYHKHKGPQNAYGDYTLVKVGPRYYIFCDYDPHGRPMRIGHWFSDSIDERFEWGGGIGKGFHPDPTMGFAEGKFYLIVQGHHNYVSRGPWVPGVEARAGVDTDGDGKVDEWTDWQTVREEYSRKDGFARVVERSPAKIDLTALPAGRGFKFAFRVNRDGGAKPVMDRVSLSFE